MTSVNHLGISRRALDIPLNSLQMGCTTTALGHAFDGLENEPKTDSTIPLNCHDKKDAHKLPVHYSSKLPGRRLRPAKTHSLHHKNRKAITNSISRSFPVETKSTTESGSTTLLPPLDSPNRDRKTVCFFYVNICAIKST